jgi:hypothetical protein
VRQADSALDNTARADPRKFGRFEVRLTDTVGRWGGAGTTSKWRACTMSRTFAGVPNSMVVNICHHPTNKMKGKQR